MPAGIGYTFGSFISKPAVATKRRPGFANPPAILARLKRFHRNVARNHLKALIDDHLPCCEAIWI